MANVLESCLFCGLPHAELIPFETFSAEYKTRRMVAEKHADVVQDRLPNRDVAAAEMKYHFECLTSYRNQYRSYLRQHSRIDDATIHYQQCKMAAHHELYLFMMLELKIGVIIEFSRQLLKEKREESLKNLGYEMILNKDLFSQDVLVRFEDFSIQMKKGWKNTFVFPSKVIEELENADNMFKEDVKEVFMKYAAIILKERLQVTTGYKGSLTEIVSFPGTQSLVSKILYGSDCAVSNSNPTNTLCQLFYFNIKSKGTAASTKNIRHSRTKEIGLKIHCESRNKSLIEVLSSLGLSISYDRVLSIGDLQGHNISKQFEKEGVVCPRASRKNTFTVCAMDNIDAETSSSTSEGHLHGNAITLMQPKPLNGIVRHQLEFLDGPFDGSL